MALQKEIRLIAGSDAHRPEDVGRFFDKIPELLEQLTSEINGELA
jgi:histidinol phosphatase-like PHP family hydrolase